MVGAYVIAFVYSWALTLVSSSAILFILLAYGGIVPIFIKAQQSVDHAYEKATSIAGEVFGSIRTVTALGAEDEMTARYTGWIGEARKRGLKMSRLAGAQMAPVFFAIYCDFALTFWFGVKLYREGHIASVGTVIT